MNDNNPGKKYPVWFFPVENLAEMGFINLAKQVVSEGCNEAT